MKVKNGEKVSKGDLLLEIYAQNDKAAEEARDKYLSSVTINDEEPEKNTLIYTLDD